MATNASTWFYNPPEQNAYLIEERVNHTFWNNRISALYLRCVSAEAPFQMQGNWHDIPITIEWEPNTYFKLTTQVDDRIDLLIVGITEILGFLPTISYVNPSNDLNAEWHVNENSDVVQSIQNNPNYRNIKRYKQ